jgi:drug/metabolite transporter (DMT)-like permease
MIAIALLLVIVVAGTSGELCVARAMKSGGEVADFRPVALLRSITAALRTPWIWLGLVLMAVYVCGLLALLSIRDVSDVVPATALSYVIGAVGGRFFLGEQVAPARWLGVCLVCSGVALVFMGA